MKKLLINLTLLFLFLGIANNLRSQEFAPIGAKWHYPVNSLVIGGVIQKVFIFESVDTVTFNGLLYKEIALTSNVGSPFPPTYYVREENGKVYILLGYEPQEYLMFDKNPTVGDLWYYPFNENFEGGSLHWYYGHLFETVADINDSITFKITDVIDTTFNNLQAKKIRYLQRNTMHGESPEDTVFYGSSEIFTPMGFLQSFFLTHDEVGMFDFNSPGPLRCYEDSYWGLIQLDTSVACDFTSTPNALNDIAEEINVAVFPNPARDWLRVQLKDVSINTAELSIYDALGRQVYNGNLKKANDIEIPTAQFTKGVYLLQITSDNGRRFGKRFVKE